MLLGARKVTEESKRASGLGFLLFFPNVRDVDISNKTKYFCLCKREAVARVQWSVMER